MRILLLVLIPMLAAAEPLRWYQAQRVSPVHWPIPQARIFDAVVGSLESSEFLRQSQFIADTWRARGTVTRYESIAGTNHFTIVDALSDPNSAMVARLAQLCQSTQSIA